MERWCKCLSNLVWNVCLLFSIGTTALMAHEQKVGTLVITPEGKIVQSIPSPLESAQTKKIKEAIKQAELKNAKAEMGQEAPSLPKENNEKLPLTKPSGEEKNTKPHAMVANPKLEQQKLNSKNAKAKQVNKVKGIPIPLISVDLSEIDSVELDYNTLRLVPNFTSKTFRLKLMASQEFNVAIVRHKQGVYLVLDVPFTPELVDLPGLRNVVDFIEILPSENYTIVKFYLAPSVITRYEIEATQKFLRFFHVEKARLANVLAPASIIVQENLTWPNFRYTGLSEGFGQIIPIEGINYYILMTRTPDGGIEQTLNTPWCSSVPTHQGIAFKVNDEQTFFDFSNNVLTIQPRASDDSKVSDVPEAAYVNLFEVDHKIDLREKLMRLQDLLKRETYPFPISHVMELAWLKTQLDLGFEASAALDNLANIYPALSSNVLYKSLLGMALFINGKTKEALKAWEYLPHIQEIDTWKAIALAETGQYDGVEQYLEYALKLLPTYSKNLRETLIKRILNICIAINFPNIVQYIADKIDWGGSHAMNALVHLSLANIYFENKNYLATEQMLQEMKLKLFREQPNMMLKAYSDYFAINLSLAQKAITEEGVIEKLDIVSYYWREDSLEYRILAQMFLMQDQMKNYAKALEVLRKIKRQFPLQATIELVDTQIQRIFYNFIKSYDKSHPLRVISIYAQFADYLPEGKVGEEMITRISNAFVKLGLLDDAAEILNRSLRDMNDGVPKINRIFEIADLYFKNKKYDSVLAILDTIYIDNVTLDLKTKIITEKAKALFAMEQTEKASALLESSTEPYHIIFSSQVYMEQKQWSKVIEILEPLLFRMDSKNKKDKELLPKLLNYLVIGLVMDGIQDDQILKPSGQKKNKKNDVQGKKLKKDEKQQVTKPKVNRLEKSAKDMAQEIANTLKTEPSPQLIKAITEMNNKAHKHQSKLDNLRAQYGQLMKDQPMFELLTRPKKVNMFSLKEAQDILGDADELLQFIDSQK